MTIPTIFALGSESLLIAPVLRNGGSQHVKRTATIPAATATTTVIGMIPFQKGARVDYTGTSLRIGDLDTGTDVTLDVGYVYTNDATYTNDPDAFIVASTGGQTALSIEAFSAVAGFTFEAEADGYIAVTVGGGATTTEGDIDIDAIISYNVR